MDTSFENFMIEANIKFSFHNILQDKINVAHEI